jgi:hypothetical protein
VITLTALCALAVAVGWAHYRTYALEREMSNLSEAIAKARQAQADMESRVTEEFRKDEEADAAAIATLPQIDELKANGADTEAAEAALAQLTESLTKFHVVQPAETEPETEPVPEG